jgi:putative transposase
MVSVQARREQASYAIDRGLSQRVACALLKISRSNLYYLHKMPVKDAPVIEAMKNLSGLYPRFGSRRIRIFLQREGIHTGKERCGRIWAKAGLQVLKSAEESVSAQHCGHWYQQQGILFGVTILCMMHAPMARR